MKQYEINNTNPGFLKSPIEFDNEWVVKFAKGNSILPKNFPILIENNTGQICEPVLLFLIEKKTKKGLPLLLNSRKAYCKDLKEWFQYLDNFEINWLHARKIHLEAFITILSKTVSPAISEFLSANTVNRVITAVNEFYTWCKLNILKDVNEFEADSLFLNNAPVKIVSVDEDEDDDSDEKNILQRNEAKRLFSTLGDLPSKNKDYYKTSSRDRLACELALCAGLRIGDVTYITVGMIEKYRGEILDNTKTYLLKLVGKGGKAANVKFPGWILKEALLYIDGERGAVVKALGINERKLIINGFTARVHIGKPVSHRTLERNFSNACKRVGLIKEVRKSTIDEEGVLVQRNSHFAIKAKYVFHDLRHTYAIWTYYSRKRSGDTEPWISISTQLRHANVLTTIKYYLKTASDFEAVVSDTFMDWINEDN